MPAKVLISGSSGLLGSALMQSLGTDGYEITRLMRRPTAAAGQIAWDFAQPLAPQSVSGFDAVIHLAGESIASRWTESKKKAIRDSRVLGTRHLAEALARAASPPRVFISASAIGFYGDCGDEILREDSASGGSGFLPEVCREWEAAADPAVNAGTRTAFLRTGIVLSAKGGALKQMLPPFRMGLGGRISSGRQWMSWIDLQDEIGAIRHILANESLSGPVNSVSPHPVTNAEFTKTLASVLSRPAIFPMPAFAARLVFGQMGDELLLGSQRVEPAKLTASGYVFQKPDLRRALRDILKT
ncbi:MAG TPA: TIGR01777 family oxidoreductase [Terriglobales bacterium]|nr:TIGR01777 family oxidoreductase [Terriglobales bacterium]